MAVGNNGTRMVGNTEFYGGLSTDNKIGIENSYADGECLDVRKSPSQMTVLPMARTLPDSGVITGLMTAMTQSKDGNIWGIDENGKVYKIDENNSITAVSDGENEIISVSSSTITNVTVDDDISILGEIYIFTYYSDSSKWSPYEQPDGIKYSKEELSSEWGISYDGTPANGDTIAVDYGPGAHSSGFSLENSDIDDGLWWADGGHKLFSYGRVLNPTGANRATTAFEFLEDHSEYLDYAIEIQENGDQIFYQSDPDIVRSAGTENVTILTSVSEDIENKILFLPAAIPIAKIGVRFHEQLLF